MQVEGGIWDTCCIYDSSVSRNTEDVTNISYTESYTTGHSNVNDTAFKEMMSEFMSTIVKEQAKQTKYLKMISKLNSINSCQINMFYYEICLIFHRGVVLLQSFSINLWKLSD